MKQTFIVTVLVLLALTVKGQEINEYHLSTEYMNETVVLESFNGQIKKNSYINRSFSMAAGQKYKIAIVKYRRNEIISVYEEIINSDKNEPYYFSVNNSDSKDIEYQIIVGVLL